MRLAMNSSPYWLPGNLNLKYHISYQLTYYATTSRTSQLIQQLARRFHVAPIISPITYEIYGCVLKPAVQIWRQQNMRRF